MENTRGQLIDGFPGRPSHGTNGKEIVLRTNYFQLKTAYETGADEVPLYRYSVNVEGENLSKPKMRVLMRNVLNDPIFAGMQVATDYASIIVTTKKVDLGPANRKKAKIELIDQNQPPIQGPDTPQAQEAKQRRTKQYALSASGQFRLAELVDSLQKTSPGSWFGGRGDVIQLLNIIIGKKPNETNEIYSMGQNKYFPDGHATLMESHDIGQGLQALRGYFSSVRTSTNRILVNVNVASAAFYKSIPVMNLIAEFVGDRNFNSPRVPGPRDLSKVETFIRMLRVRTNHLKVLGSDGKPKRDASGQVQPITSYKTIVAFASKPRFGDAKQVKFSWSDAKNPQARARDVSVFDYFQSQHNITLSHPEWPVLNVGTKSDPSYLPVELATVWPGQPVRRLLSSSQTTEMINFAARRPALNATSIAGSQGNPGNGLKVMGLNGPAQVTTVVSIMFVL